MTYDVPGAAVGLAVPGAALAVALEVGIARANYAFANNLENYGDDLSQSQQMAHHIRAARTECAVKHYVDLPWHEAIGVLGGPDVGDNIQVRSRPCPPGGDLAFRPAKDKDDDAFVLVWDCGSDWFWLIGWLWGDELRARPDKVYAGGYKYVKAPYRPVPLLFSHISRHRVVRAQTTPSAPSALEHLRD